MLDFVPDGVEDVDTARTAQGEPVSGRAWRQTPRCGERAL